MQPSIETRNLGIRAIHYILDIIFSWALSFLVVMAFYLSGMGSLIEALSERLLGYIFLGIYYLIFEVGFGSPISHHITRSTIISIDGNKPSRGQLLKRSLLRIIPIDWLTFFFGKNKGLHDSGSGTYLVSRKSLRLFQKQVEQAGGHQPNTR